MPIYLEYEGIKGNVTAGGYKDHIEISSIQFGVGRGISMTPGHMANREASRPSISEVTITKSADKTIIQFFKESVVGVAGKTAKFKFTHTGGDKIVEYMTVNLSDVLVSGYSLSGAGAGEPQESISLSFAKIEISYNDYVGNNKTNTPQRAGYDLATAKPI